MPFITIAQTPLLPGVTPVEIHYREYGNGVPLVFLHGGWGYEIYPFDSQIRAFGDQFNILIPDRSGYGRSRRIESLPADFHSRAAREMLSFLDALKVEKSILWGHSDGAVIAALMGIQSPDRFGAVLLEAFHFYRDKPASREFFETMATGPEGFGERVSQTLARDHGDDYWKDLIYKNGLAWLRIAQTSAHSGDDLYGGRLSQLKAPTLFLHGSDDPRTEPGELQSAYSLLPQAELGIIEGGGHAPHSKRSAFDECNRIAGDFLRKIALKPV